MRVNHEVINDIEIDFVRTGPFSITPAYLLIDRCSEFSVKEIETIPKYWIHLI